MNYCGLKEVYDQTLVWEKELGDLYDVALYGLKNGDSKRLVGELADDHEKNLRVLRCVDISVYGRAEWLKFAPSLEDAVVPKKEIGRDTSPGEIADRILNYQEKLKKFYGVLKGVVSGKKQKDLFESLELFKERQIAVIRSIRKEIAGGN